MNRFPTLIRRYFPARRPVHARLFFPIDLRQNRVYVFPTRQGFVFFALLFAILFGSLSHNNNLGFLLTFLLGGMVFVSTLHTYRNISGLRLISAKAKPVFAGQAAQFEISLQAAGYNQYSLLFYFDDGEPATVNLTAGIRSVVPVSHKTDARGTLLPTQLYVATTYPLGLLRCWSSLFIDATCLVYPKPISGPMITAQSTQKDATEGVAYGEGVDDFAGLTVYQPGDPLQRISWKTISRGQGLHTKVFEGQRGNTLYFDPDKLGSRNLEYKLSRICHMILQAEIMHMSYGLKIGNRIIEPGQGGAHKRLCLSALAMAGK